MAYLAQQRSVLQIAAYGLTDEQARAVPTAQCPERRRPGQARHGRRAQLGRHRPPAPARGTGATPRQRMADYADAFTMGPSETLAGLIADQDAAAARDRGGARLARPRPAGPRPAGRPLVPRRRRRLVRPLGAAAPHPGDGTARRARRHRPREHRRRHGIRADGGCRGVAGHRLAEAMASAGRGGRGLTHPGPVRGSTGGHPASAGSAGSAAAPDGSRNADRARPGRRARHGPLVSGVRTGPWLPPVRWPRLSSAASAPTPGRRGTARWPSLRGNLPRWPSRWCGRRSTSSSATAPARCWSPSLTRPSVDGSPPWSLLTSRRTPAGAGSSSGVAPPPVGLAGIVWSSTRSTSSCCARPPAATRKAAAALAPYVAWTLFATALNADIWRRNR